jgi:hypothetical protein
VRMVEMPELYVKSAWCLLPVACCLLPSPKNR